MSCRNIEIDTNDPKEIKQITSAICNFIEESRLKEVFSRYTDAMIPDMRALTARITARVAAGQSLSAAKQGGINDLIAQGSIFQINYLYENKAEVFEGYYEINTHVYSIGKIKYGLLSSCNVCINVSKSDIHIEFYKDDGTQDGINNLGIKLAGAVDTLGSPYTAGTLFIDPEGPRLSFSGCVNILKILGNALKIEYIGLNDAAHMPCLGPAKQIMFEDNTGGISLRPKKNALVAMPRLVYVNHISIVRILAGKDAFYVRAGAIPVDQGLGWSFDRLKNATLAATQEADKDLCKDYLADTLKSPSMFNKIRGSFSSLTPYINKCNDVTDAVNRFLGTAVTVLGGAHTQDDAERIFFNWRVPTGYTPGSNSMRTEIAEQAVRNAENTMIQAAAQAAPASARRSARSTYKKRFNRLKYLTRRHARPGPTRMRLSNLYGTDRTRSLSRFQKLKKFGSGVYNWITHLRTHGLRGRTKSERIFSAKKRATRGFSAARRRLGLSDSARARRRLGLMTARRRVP